MTNANLIGKKIEYSAKFLRKLKKLPFTLQQLAVEREIIFKSSIFDPRLETHKLHGKDRDHWAYSINYKYRIKFIFLSDGNVLYLDVGTHDEVY
ncbi:MAG TPA: type II toxin-antitoxin system mRNA interferase toxin, RelE/StbE family [Candidatus Paceibacterota bacterium]